MVYNRVYRIGSTWSIVVVVTPAKITQLLKFKKVVLKIFNKKKTTQKHGLLKRDFIQNNKLWWLLTTLWGNIYKVGALYFISTSHVKIAVSSQTTFKIHSLSLSQQ